VKRAAAFLFLVAAAAFAHSISRAEVIAHLSTDEVRAREAIQRVWSPSEKPTLLIIEVSKGWLERSGDSRRAAARRWLELWHHAVPRGRVSVVDSSGQAVIRYTPSGEVQLRE
jgi:hypothetical protein